MNTSIFCSVHGLVYILTVNHFLAYYETYYELIKIDINDSDTNTMYTALRQLISLEAL